MTFDIFTSVQSILWGWGMGGLTYKRTFLSTNTIIIQENVDPNLLQNRNILYEDMERGKSRKKENSL